VLTADRDPALFSYVIEPFSGNVPEEELICWQAPTFAALGWVPLATAADQLPDCYFRSAWDDRLALRLLLGSGNSTAADRFDGLGDFLQSLALKDFRSALVVDEPKLYCAPDGTPVRFTCWRGHKVGFTPVRQAGILVAHLPGYCEEHYAISAAANEVTFNFWMRFKLSKLADWIGVAMVRHFAPWAIINIRLVMRSSGQCDVTFLSSFVPSQRFYLDWRGVYQYDMVSCSDDEFRQFIEAGKCKDSPMVKRFEIELQAKRIR
jgi:hypothetical protein